MGREILREGAYFVSQYFGDVDELGELTRGWDLDFRQLSRGRFRGELAQIGTSSFMASKVRLEGIIHQHGSAPAVLRSFAFSRRREHGLLWRGHQIGRDQVLVFPTDGELDSTSMPDFDVFVLSVDEQSLDEAAARAGIPGIPATLAESEVLTCEAKPLAALRRLVAPILIRPSRPVEMDLSPKALAVLKRRAADLLVRAIASSRLDEPGRHWGLRAQLAEDAARIARANRDEIITVSALCEEVGANPRTLRRGFRECFGVTPEVYLKAQRLIGVRRALREADPARMRVTDVANLYGFWHLGQLAADYREHFGELPSVTLHRALPSPTAIERD